MSDFGGQPFTLTVRLYCRGTPPQRSSISSLCPYSSSNSWSAVQLGFATLDRAVIWGSLWPTLICTSGLPHVEPKEEMRPCCSHLEDQIILEWSEEEAHSPPRSKIWQFPQALRHGMLQLISFIQKSVDQKRDSPVGTARLSISRTHVSSIEEAWKGLHKTIGHSPGLHELSSMNPCSGSSTKGGLKVLQLRKHSARGTALNVSIVTYNNQNLPLIVILIFTVCLTVCSEASELKISSSN